MDRLLNTNGAEKLALIHSYTNSQMSTPKKNSLLH